MRFQQCGGVFVSISCYSSVALQLMRQCLYTAPSYVAAAETPSRPLCDIVAAWEVLAGGSVPAPSLQRLADNEHSPGSPQSNM